MARKHNTEEEEEDQEEEKERGNNKQHMFSSKRHYISPHWSEIKRRHHNIFFDKFIMACSL
jgi:predicted FMN-binding regulatory protein PaiB